MNAHLALQLVAHTKAKAALPVPPIVSIEREWEGETGFIIGGGPSVLTQDISRLQGRRVLVINSSYQAAPWADFLLFSDDRWWADPFHKCHRDRVGDFKGRILSAGPSARGERLLKLRRQQPPGLALRSDTVTVNFTTYTAAINVLVHLGCRKIVMLGADGKKSEQGLTHHHEPHDFKTHGMWDAHRRDLKTLVAPLKALGIECVNASPGTAWADLWPVTSLDDVLRLES
ncbi:MAG: Methyltransferase type 11 [Rhizobium sp.]|nr:Methyltransferase type 11 [Rhizobium sp.]